MSDGRFSLVFGKALEAYGKNEIVEIIDMSAFVAQQREVIGDWRSGKLLTPSEQVYVPSSPSAAANVGLDEWNTIVEQTANLNLTPIGQHGQLPEAVTPDDHLRMVVEMTVRHFEKVGFAAPWIGYVAIVNSVPVGTCAFKSPPVDGRVEIAYGTMPGFEGQGIATAMARELVRIARQESEGLTVFAQALPEENASTTILKKLGFQLVGTVEHPEDGTVWEWELSANNSSPESESP